MLRVPALPGTPPSPKETAGLAEPCAQGSPALPTVSSTALSSQGSDRQEKLWVAQDTSTTSRGVKGLTREASVATPQAMPSAAGCKATAEVYTGETTLETAWSYLVKMKMHTPCDSAPHLGVPVCPHKRSRQCRLSQQNAGNEPNVHYQQKGPVSSRATEHKSSMERKHKYTHRGPASAPMLSQSFRSRRKDQVQNPKNETLRVV